LSSVNTSRHSVRDDTRCQAGARSFVLLGMPLRFTLEGLLQASVRVIRRNAAGRITFKASTGGGGARPVRAGLFESERPDPIGPDHGLRAVDHRIPNSTALRSAVACRALSAAIVQLVVNLPRCQAAAVVVQPFVRARAPTVADQELATRWCARREQTQQRSHKRGAKAGHRVCATTVMFAWLIPSERASRGGHAAASETPCA